MDIKVDRLNVETTNRAEKYVSEKLSRYFDNYPFLNSVKVFFRGDKHKYKKIKLQARLKGKDIFVEAEGENHSAALDAAIEKMLTKVEKYKSKHYKRA